MRANRSIGGTLDDNAIDATLNGVSPNHTYDTVGGTGSSGRRRTIKLLTFYNPSPGTINVDIHKSNADVTFIPISIKNAGGAVTQHNLGIAGTAVLGNTASISAPPGAGKAFTQPAFFVAGAVRHCSRHRGDDARPRRVLPGTRDTASSTARLSRTRAEAPGRGSRSASESMSRAVQPDLDLLWPGGWTNHRCRRGPLGCLGRLPVRPEVTPLRRPTFLA